MNVKYRLVETDGLIVVDVQEDFIKGGALPVPDGAKIIPALNKYIDKFKAANAKIFATRDWHPPNHISFKGYGGIWPPHCIQGTNGAEFHHALKLPSDTALISKATDPLRESYSGFDGTKLERELKKRGIIRIFVGGLATDYCVKRTVLDGLQLGFETVLLEDAIKGIDQNVGDSKKAICEMIEKGAGKTMIRYVATSKSSEGRLKVRWDFGQDLKAQ